MNRNEKDNDNGLESDTSYEKDDIDDEEGGKGKKKKEKQLSKRERKLKKLGRVAQLKALVKRPDLVEVISFSRNHVI